MTVTADLILSPPSPNLFAYVERLKTLIVYGTV